MFWISWEVSVHICQSVDKPWLARYWNFSMCAHAVHICGVLAKGPYGPGIFIQLSCISVRSARQEKTKLRTGLSETDCTVSRKRYFIGVAYVYKNGLTLGKEVCRHLRMNSGDTCIFCVFLVDFHCLENKTVVTMRCFSTFKVKSKCFCSVKVA